MSTKSLTLLFAVGLAIQQASASPILIESWENTLDGWTVESGLAGGANSNGPVYTSAFSTTTGVTAGSYSLALTGTAGPNYGQMLQSSYSQSLTTLLGGSSSISLDIYAPPASFGFFLQFDMDINNADTGFQSLDGFSYPATSIGNETTLTFNISTSMAATLASSSNPTQIILQVGGGNSAGNETVYLDNLAANPVPEPGIMALFALGALGLFKFGRRGF